MSRARSSGLASIPVDAKRKRRRRVKENDEYAGFCRRALRGLGRRCADGDLRALADLAQLHDEVEHQLEVAIGELRGAAWAYSWAQIADALGTTRQGAQQRFRKTGGVRLPGGQPSRWR